MNKKRILTILMIFALLFTSIPMTPTLKANAASADSTSGELVTKVLKVVKGKIRIPSEYTVFEHSYSEDSSTGNTYFYFNWYNEDYEKYISVISDQEGNISSYMSNDYSKEKEVPKYLKDELKDEGEAFIKKVAPSIFSQVKYVDSIFTSIHQGYYIYSYVRVANTYTMPDQTVTVGVDATTGEVVYFNTNWIYSLSIPKSDVKITLEEAKEIVGKNVEMKLAYITKYDADAKDNKSVKALLVYQPTSTYLAIDAKTGEVYNTQSEWITTVSQENETADSAASKADSEYGGSGNLTEKEVEQISKLENLISKKKAISIIKDNKYLYLDKNASSITARLYEESVSYLDNDNKRYVWQITFADPRPVDYSSDDFYRGYAYARIDATTGEILAYRTTSEVFETYNADASKVEKKLSKKEGKALFEKFAKQQNSKRFAATELSNAAPSYIIGKVAGQEVYGGYTYTYQRMNEGIPYAENYINGSVDAVTGKVMNYGYSWYQNITFESPKNVIDAKKAFDYFINFDGFELVYEINTKNEVTQKNADKKLYVSDYKVTFEPRLVYQMSINPSYVSPYTGKQLDWSGDEYIPAGNKYEYKDINGHKYERSIKLLSDMGVGFEGENYNPDQGITKDELNQLFKDFYYYRVKETLTGSSIITRQEAAEFAITYLELSYVAEAKNIYKVDYADANEIKDSLLGYVALAKGLGLLSGNTENKFQPTANLTRGEAADMMIQMLQYAYQ